MLKTGSIPQSARVHLPFMFIIKLYPSYIGIVSAYRTVRILSKTFASPVFTISTCSGSEIRTAVVRS